MIPMAFSRYGFTAIGILLISLGLSALLYASGIITNLWLLFSLNAAAIGAWTIVYGLGYKEAERSFYSGWGAFLILMAISFTAFGILSNFIYAFALLAIGIGILILLAVYKRR
ncbi:hypothetical protein KEJ19_00445 [Candidatus Bathyarchaeota archaeon]|nr:hypothetical protein [Candidatus Bathyarchaeota archaeon]